MKTEKRTPRERRKLGIRKKITGTTERPRMSVYRSNKHIYVQVIDDSTGNTLASASTLSPELEGKLEGDKRESAKLVGELAAKKCLAAKVEAVVFDRNGFIYSGRIAALADGARGGGLRF
jgi:large subunit ribosomal protein L18